MCPIYSNGQPMDCKFPRGVCLAQDLIIPPFKLVISRKYARDFSVECNQSPYLYNEHDLWLYYADSSHPSLSQQEKVYIRILYSPQIIHPGFLPNGFDSLSGTYRNKKHRVHHTMIFTTIFYPPIALDNLENDRFFFSFEWQIQFKMQIWEWRPSFTRLMNNKFSCSSILKSQFKFLFCTNTALHPHRQSAYLAIK